MKRISLLLAAALLLTLSGCAASAAMAGDLMDGVSPGRVTGSPPDAAFIGGMADFSIELFKQSAGGENALISPLSVTLALAMTANGADGETLRQMEALLGGGIPIDRLNKYLYSYIKRLPTSEKSKLNIANSIWLRDDKDVLQAEPAFLQTNADHYGAAAYKAPFDGQTLKDVNNWVSENTGGLIKEILSEINPNDVMYLINTVLFDAEWQRVYYENNVREGDFTDIHGNTQTAAFMHSSEYQYLNDGMATGFIKPYANNDYSFAALLPNEGVPIEAYIRSLTGAGFLDTIQNAQEELVYAALPKFSYAYGILLNDALMALGIPDAFDAGKADFTKMGHSPAGNIYIDRVIHKTFIAVDELGTKAGAATLVAMDAGGLPADPKTVRLDRPFVYAIIDNAANLPVFIGAVMTL